MRVRTYGQTGPRVVLLHGGPGAPGSMGAIGRELADAFRVLEPYQRTSDEADGEPLTVARHVADLRAILEEIPRHEGPPALIGSSWGAMLALAYAAEFEDVGPIVLIGCGTFDAASRARFRAAAADRIVRHPELSRRLAEIPVRLDPDERLRRRAEVMDEAYSVDLIEAPEIALCDARGNRGTWEDMLRLQESGVYPAAFERVRAQVLMLHGTDDPHPGPSTRDTLRVHVPHLEYHGFERCGHYPWLERHARDAFYRVLRGWLIRHTRVERSAERHHR